jgi:hypothetical protein
LKIEIETRGLYDSTSRLFKTPEEGPTARQNVTEVERTIILGFDIRDNRLPTSNFGLGPYRERRG